MSDFPGTEELESLDAYWRAANYLTVGQIYLQDNALLTRPLTLADVKPRLLGHWGTSPGLNLIYTHLNRLIRQYSLDVLFVTGPGHGGPALVAQAYLDGTYTELNPSVGRNALGMARLFRQFSWPYGISSHVSAQVPGSIHEGGELGYSLAHAYGAAFDNPDLIVACVIGDGEAESDGFSRAGARRDQEVAPFELWRRGGGLDFGEVFVTTFVDGRAEGGGQGFRQIHGGDKTFRRHNRCPMARKRRCGYGRAPHTG